MAIDSTLFAADIPAAAYAVGDVVNMSAIDGPANVRSGRGTAILKNILVGQFVIGSTQWRVHIKNSDWIDEVSSFTAPLEGSTTMFDEESGCSQNGHDLKLTENSGWIVYAECVAGGTAAVNNSIFAIIDVDYPQVSGVTSPASAVGYPTSINFDLTANLTAYGSMVGSTWDVKNIDYFKAGYQYILDAVEMASSSSTACGFIAFSNAAGMGGLCRIIPINRVTSAIRHKIKYSSVLVKGPMDVKLKLFAPSAGSASFYMSHDYVKRAA